MYHQNARSFCINPIYNNRDTASSNHNQSHIHLGFIEMPDETPKSILFGEKEKVERDFIHTLLDKIGGFR
ncbi:MAG: hypothetical protein CME25_07555 [Gemmatimonadetes bacterium]|nr:hypothetical protein [Gemmatimonadota bacterium]